MNIAKQLRVGAAAERQLEFMTLTAKTKETREDLKEQQKQLKHMQREMCLSQSPSKKARAAEPVELRTVNIKGSGFEKFNVVVTPAMTLSELVDCAAEKTGKEASTLTLKRGRTVLTLADAGALTLVDVGLYDEVELTLTKRK